MDHSSPFLLRLFYHFKSVPKCMALLFSAVLVVSGAYVLAIYIKLPSVDALVIRDSEPVAPLLQYEKLPSVAVFAIVAEEDKNFFSHEGIDYLAVLRAIKQLAESGKLVSGASTITMQLAKNSLLGQDKSLARKLSQYMLAAKIERNLSKEEILEMYLSSIYFGENAYGIEAASQLYFEKTLPELTLAEAAMLAGMPKAPSIYNPIASPDAALARRDWVLERMLVNGFIEKSEFEEALASNS